MLFKLPGFPITVSSTLLHDVFIIIIILVSLSILICISAEYVSVNLPEAHLMMIVDVCLY